MFPDDVKQLAPREHRAVARGTTARKPGADVRDGGLAVVAVGGQRGTLYDSFELNAMVARLNRVLNGDGAEARRPRRSAGSWLAAPKVLFRKIKGAFLGGRRGGVAHE